MNWDIEKGKYQAQVVSKLGRNWVKTMTYSNKECTDDYTNLHTTCYLSKELQVAINLEEEMNKFGEKVNEYIKEVASINP